MTRLLLLLGLLAIGAPPAEAAARRPAWRLQLVHPSGLPHRCVLVGPELADGSSLAFRLGPDLQLEASIANDAWQMTEADQPPLRIALDGTALAADAPGVSDPQTLRLELGEASTVLPRLKAAKVLEAASGSRVLRFPLKSHKRALDRLRKCAETGTLPGGGTGRAANPRDARFHAALGEFVLAVLRGAAVDDVRLYDVASEKGAVPAPNMVHWDSESRGIGGFVLIARLEGERRLEALVRQGLDGFETDCNGDLARSLGPPAEIEGTRVQDGIAVCRGGGGPAQTSRAYGMVLIVPSADVALSFVHFGSADGVAGVAELNARLRDGETVGRLSAWLDDD